MEADYKKYSVRLPVEKVKEAKKILGDNPTLVDLFEEVLDQFLEIKKGNYEKIELDSSKIFDFKLLENSITKQNVVVQKLVENFSMLLKRKDDPIFDFVAEGYWSRVNFDGLTAQRNDPKSYRRGDILETNSFKLFLVTDINLDEKNLELVQLPLHPESKKTTLDLADKEKENLIALLWRK